MFLLFFGQISIVSKGINNIFKDCSCCVYGTSEILVNTIKADNNPTTYQLKLFFLKTWNLLFMKVINVLTIFFHYWYFTHNFICQVVPMCVEKLLVLNFCCIYALLWKPKNIAFQHFFLHSVCLNCTFVIAKH